MRVRLLFWVYNFVFFFFTHKTKQNCDFSNNSLIKPFNGGKKSLYISDTKIEDNENVIDNNIQYCVTFTKGFEKLRFVCPKKKKNYEGIEVRPSTCFESVRINGQEQELSNIIKGVIIKNEDTDELFIRTVFFPPTIYDNFIFECTCDNNLTFKNGIIGLKGVIKVHLKKTITFGCDFDHYSTSPSPNNDSSSNISSFTNYYDKKYTKLDESIKCKVIINKKEVNLGIVCPEDFILYPNNCFEEVLLQNNDKTVSQLKDLIPHPIKFHKDIKNRMSFAAFTLDANENKDSFACHCIKNNDNTLVLKAIFSFSNYESYTLALQFCIYLLIPFVIAFFLL
ncbi:6-cysteine protein, putative [Hepatocystis sp. ex Piliocolobus tephrosceles]|nr:6-cysteine protein, putative [Hepatocystis sp. ex Piliocolobus tephrosceles]